MMRRQGRRPTVLGLAATALVLAVAAACGGTPPVAAPGPPGPGPMMQPRTESSTGDLDRDTDRDGMMGGRWTTTAAVPHSGALPGEQLDPAAVATLQAAVDQGSQPWRLDPELVALAFVRGHLGWMMPRPQRTAPDTVLVDDGPGGAVALRVVQPGRTGTTGVWTVAGGTWVR